MQFISKFGKFYTNTLLNLVDYFLWLRKNPSTTFQEQDELRELSPEIQPFHAIHTRIQQAIHIKHSYAT